MEPKAVMLSAVETEVPVKTMTHSFFARVVVVGVVALQAVTGSGRDPLRNYGMQQQTSTQ